MKNWARGLTFSLLIISLCACASPVRLTNQGNVVSPIVMETFLINLPSDMNLDDWALSEKKDPESILLERLKIWEPTGEVQGTTSILIVKDSVLQEGWNLTEKDYADHIRRLKVRLMAVKGQYEIQNLHINDIRYNDKKLYFMSWESAKGPAIDTGFEETPSAKAALYIYFPEDFIYSRNFYRFIITESYVPGTLIPVDLDTILPIIGGFELKSGSN